MTTNEIFKLIDAGFTKEDIMKLDTGAEVVPTETSKAPIETPAAPIETKVEPQVKPEPAQPSGVTLSDDQFKTLLQQLNVKGASLDVPPEADIKTKLAEHFKEVTIGK